MSVVTYKVKSPFLTKRHTILRLVENSVRVTSLAAISTTGIRNYLKNVSLSLIYYLRSQIFYRRKCLNFFHKLETRKSFLIYTAIEIRGGGTHNLDIFVYSYEFYIEGDKDIRLRSSWSSWTGGKSTVCTTLERKEIWIYTDKSFKGEKDRVEMNGSRGPCFNLNFNARNYAHGKDRNDKISSVALQGNCMRFYEHQGCLGEYLQLSPGVKEDCQENLENCPGWNDGISSIAPCDVDLPALYDNPRGSRNGRCKDACWPRGTDYFWCNLEGGSWDYCSPRPGQDYYGDMCRGTDSKGSCGYHGEAYRWCYTKEGGAATNRHWGYCS